MHGKETKTSTIGWRATQLLLAFLLPLQIAASRLAEEREILKKTTSRSRHMIADENLCFVSPELTSCSDLCGPGRHWIVTSSSFTGITLCNSPCGEVESCASDFQYITDPDLVCNYYCPDDGITAGGGLQNCFYNLNGFWQCRYSESPFSAVPASTSTLILSCDALPEIEPTAETCDCHILLADFENDVWDDTDLCSSCSILPSPLDGEWDIHWDCSNKLWGECVGVNEFGCIDTTGPCYPDPCPPGEFCNALNKDEFVCLYFNPCDPNPCQVGEVCIELSSSAYTCRNPCDPNPCGGDYGTCRVRNNGSIDCCGAFLCQTVASLETFCGVISCPNGHTCVNLPTGPSCQEINQAIIDSDLCNPSPCAVNGEDEICVNRGGGVFECLTTPLLQPINNSTVPPEQHTFEPTTSSSPDNSIPSNNDTVLPPSEQTFEPTSPPPAMISTPESTLPPQNNTPNPSSLPLESTTSEDVNRERSSSATRTGGFYIMTWSSKIRKGLLTFGYYLCMLLLGQYAP